MNNKSLNQENFTLCYFGWYYFSKFKTSFLTTEISKL